MGADPQIQSECNAIQHEFAQFAQYLCQERLDERSDSFYCYCFPWPTPNRHLSKTQIPQVPDPVCENPLLEEDKTEMGGGIPIL